MLNDVHTRAQKNCRERYCGSSLRWFVELILLYLQFIAKAGDKARTAKDGQLDRACGSLLLKICQKYDNITEIDKLAAVTQKVESVKLVMQDNVDLVLQTTVKLESIEKKAGIADIPHRE